RGGAREAGIVNDRAPILMRRHHGLDVEEWAVAIKRETHIAAKSARRRLREAHRRACAMVGRLHAPLFQRDEIRLVRPARRVVEERAPPLWILGVATP